MKKISKLTLRSLWILVIGSILMLAGCINAATNIPYASTTPPEKLCTLNVIATLTVTDFDGEKVSWSPDFGDSWSSVRIPEGRHTFTLDYHRNVGAQGEYHSQTSIRVSYDGFKSGRTYEMVAAEGAEAGGFTGMLSDPLGAMNDTANQSLRIGIRDITNGQNGDYLWLPWE